MNAALRSGERQVAPTIDDIRRDHVARYEFACTKLPSASNVIDVACGVGYGTHLMATCGHYVIGVDSSAEAITYAREHYSVPRACYVVADAVLPLNLKADAIVCFETIEHIADPLPMLTAFDAPLLLASVPNERVFPFSGQLFHHRHYTREDFESLLTAAGWTVRRWYGQADPWAEVAPDFEGWTLIVEAYRAP